MDRTLALGPPGDELLRALLRLAQAAEQRVEHEVLAASGLTLPQLRFLNRLVCEGGALSLSRVASGLCCARSNVTQLAGRLEAQALVRREPDAADGRSVRAVLTEEGRRRWEAGERARCHAERAVLAGLTGEERGLLRGIVSTLERDEAIARSRGRDGGGDDEAGDTAGG